MNNAPLTFDLVVWDVLFETLYFRQGIPPWVAAARVNAIPKPDWVDLARELYEAPDGQRSRMAALASAELFLSRRFPDLLEPSSEEWGAPCPLPSH
ncbi:MAG: hypothetical protein H6R00_195 [Proteobacteria bacterium]|nr:hypothetical protein [Pseudomonadota bacterium]